MAREEGLEFILDCVDRGLDHFGRNFMRVVYWSFASVRGRSRRDILSSPEEFKSFLYDTFGKGAEIIEREITSEIGLECNLSPMVSDIVEAIRQAQNQVLIA